MSFNTLDAHSEHSISLQPEGKVLFIMDIGPSWLCRYFLIPYHLMFNIY